MAQGSDYIVERGHGMLRSVEGSDGETGLAKQVNLHSQAGNCVRVKIHASDAFKISQKSCITGKHFISVQSVLFAPPNLATYHAAQLPIP